MLTSDQILAYKLPNMPESFDPFRELGVPVGATTAVVDSAWKNTPSPARTHNRHFAWKLLRDTAYAALYSENRNIPATYRAGFFVDRLTPEQTSVLEGSIHDLTTPFHVIADNMKSFDYTKGRPVVLVTTGGFSPIHWGHLSMMKTAKTVLEESGRNVVGGYISPSHDDYVNQKHNGTAKLSGRHRIHLAHEAVDQLGYKDWLMVDPWESQYLPTDVNFTDVIRYLKSYLERFVDPRGFDVMYVSGADNADFVDVLKHMDGGVIVSRGSLHNHLPVIFETPNIRNDCRISFVKSEDPVSEFSSSSVRRWRPQLMPAQASKTYTGWRVNMMSDDGDVVPPQRSYIIRDDGAWSMQQFFPDGPSYGVIEHLERFKADLAEAVKVAFTQVKEPDIPRRVNVHYLPLGEHQDFADELERTHNVLNLDACTNRGSGINFSRLFSVSDSQIGPVDLVSRPGFPDVQTQIDQIVPGQYVLLDDDIASGATVNHLMGLLPEGVEIVGIQTLFKHSCRLHGELGNHEVSDMVDLRDFVLGTYNGGLVVNSPNNNVGARAPYMLPFVSGHSRASIPLSSMHEFSQTCWRLNAELFERLGEGLTIGCATDEFQSLFLQLGFSHDTTLAEVSRHYESFLARSNLSFASDDALSRSTTMQV